MNPSVFNVFLSNFASATGPHLFNICAWMDLNVSRAWAENFILKLTSRLTVAV